MRRIIYSLIAVCLFKTMIYGQATDPTDSATVLKNVYRHYTGMTGNHKTSFDFRFGFPYASAFGGSTYYFADEGGLNFFITTPPAAYSHSDVFRAQVFPENIPLSDIGNAYSTLVQTIRFDFTFSNDSITGKWFNPNSQEQLPIRLKEDNSNMQLFTFKYAADSVEVTGKNNERLKAVATYTGIEPSGNMKKKDAAFINEAIARFTGGPGKEAKGTDELPQLFFQPFFAGFHAAADKGKIQDGSFNGIFMLFPVYSDDGFLVLQAGGYHYDFGSGTYTNANSYLCLDVKNRKILLAGDILIQNNDLLKKLLENAFRKKYQLDAGKKLSELFIAGTMPVTDNIILVSKGLIFSYSPATIFRENEDIADMEEMRIFLSYDELGDMLQPRFKERIGLK